MVTRIGLAVALAFFAVPAALMGSTTYYFINQNPNYSDSLAELDDTVWVAEVIEIESDSTVSALEGYEATDTAEIHSLGLLTPSESRDAALGQEGHYDIQYDGNRKWGSWILTGYRTSSLKYVTCGSGTYRLYSPGDNWVECHTYQNDGYPPIWDQPWKYHWFWGVAAQKTFLYKQFPPIHWDHQGHHNWSSDGQGEYSGVSVTW